VRRPRGSLTREAILDAAEQVVRTSGGEVTIRAVAAELQASPMALYRYFGTKDELLEALLDRVLSRVRVGPETADWAEDLRTFARAHRQVLAAHPWAVTALFAHAVPGPNAVQLGEVALGILARGGITGEGAVAAFSAVVAMNYGWCAFASARDTPATASGPAPDLALALAALPVERYPLTVAAAEPLARYGAHEQYELALDRLVAGIRARAVT
jgi:AcrR family transcriptional regulator